MRRATFFRHTEPTCGFAPRAGLTLIEILIATTLSLLLILAIAQSFATVSETVSRSRATLEMAERMRGTVLRLTNDLDSVSVPTLPWNDPSAGAGYLEIIEGWARDYDANANGTADWTETDFDTSWGDCDDILAMTVINRETPFTGYVMGSLSVPAGSIGTLQLTYNTAAPLTRTKIISNAAEVIWWTSFVDTNGNGVRDANEYFRLHRRVLLIRPDIIVDASLNQTAMPDAFFFWGNDLSVVTDSSTGLRSTNTLQDLCRRDRRFAHHPGPIASPNPYTPLQRALLLPQRNVWLPGPDNAWGISGVDDDGDGVTDGNDLDEAGAIESDDILIAENAGQDVILTQVLAFDVKVFDALAPLRPSLNGVDLLAPGDPRFGTTTTAVAGAGEFVDLGYAMNSSWGMAYPTTFMSTFSGPPKRTNGQPLYPSPTWDTWPTIYEIDGLNQDDAPPNPILIDEGFDGIDNDGANGVDDHAERETTPPYPSPLRGVRVTIRCVDPATRQVRQEHVTANFRPE